MDTAIVPGANFQALAFVNNADTLGHHGLYGLDIIGNDLIEIHPGHMAPTGRVFHVMPGPAWNACSGGGQGNMFVQVQNGGLYEIWRLNTQTGIWGPHAPTPMAGTVAFEGLAFKDGWHYGIDVVGPHADIWRGSVGTGWLHVGSWPTLNWWGSAMGAF
jgi:hypothetical protein